MEFELAFEEEGEFSLVFDEAEEFDLTYGDGEALFGQSLEFDESDEQILS